MKIGKELLVLWPRRGLPVWRLSVFGGARPFKRSGAIRDALAGVTLASMNIPQVLGYTRIAGTPVVTGLYTVLLPLVAFSMFGSSRHLVVAADSATAAIFFGSLSRIAVPGSEKYMALVGMVALLTAGLLFLAWIFKLGFLADFLSRTVLVGFLTGVGIQVGIAMLGDMLGVAVHSRRTVAQAWEVMHGLPLINLPTLLLSTLVAGGILLGNRLAPRWPFSLFAAVGADCHERSVPVRRAGHRDHWSSPRGTTADGFTRGDLERNRGASASRRFLLCDDHRPKRCDIAHIRAALSRAGRRGRRHPRALSRQCNSRD